MNMPSYKTVTQTIMAIWLDFGCTVLPVEISGEVLLGRKGASDQKVIDLSGFDAYALGVSRIHAALFCENGRLYLEDRGSDEGTWLRDQLCMPFKRYELMPGDVIRLGRLEMRLNGN